MVLRLTPNQKIEVRFLYPLLSISGTHGHTVLFPYLARPPAWMVTMRDRGHGRIINCTHESEDGI